MKLGDVPPPSWRTRIGNALYEGAKWPPDQVSYFLDQLLTEHAHELAEKIRNSEELRDLTDDHMSDCNAAADLIDPEVSDNGG
ncbi:hypothetical protein [Streptomyces himalayensis]|uniref:Uncharacterized protein n=1 Tax=Streptomyces himalayensis subsp. himalayensis TaxID=2756131 RepID=A0A7W0DV36_9ACTN|nr:hypothetical protein [Streptomyces himalayensis]MBA2951450.1 hypothetical protein [Streptomyces himalayensis subsp. himalayensis]